MGRLLWHCPFHRPVGVSKGDIFWELDYYDGYGRYCINQPPSWHFCGHPSYGHAFIHENCPIWQCPRVYGLVCHAACYALLQSEIGYKLLYSDVWPILEGAAETALANEPDPGSPQGVGPQGECLQWHVSLCYGGMRHYQDTVGFPLGCSLCTSPALEHVSMHTHDHITSSA